MTTASTILLVAGLVLSFVAAVPQAADVALQLGLVLLMLTPVTAVIGAIVAEVRAREWQFVALGVVVVGLLGGSLVVALR
jgi:uncharacterized membrane protein